MTSWIKAARPRTLPLALSTVGLGGVLAYLNGFFKLDLLLLSILTTTLLQILSNFANDYGDSKHGADNPAFKRQGPARAVQMGDIKPGAMMVAIVLTSILAFVSGLALLYHAFGTDLTYWKWFLGIGVACILAAITYTMGFRPYGYAGLGDLSVFVFFGLVGVMGSYFLYARTLNELAFQGACFVGLMSVQVLNLNNMRDIESDKLAGKFSIPVRIGIRLAMIYHVLLMLGSVVAASLILSQLPIDLWKMVVILIPLMNLFAMVTASITRVRKGESVQLFDKLLPRTAITTAGTVTALAIWSAIEHFSINLP